MKKIKILTDDNGRPLSESSENAVPINWLSSMEIEINENSVSYIVDKGEYSILKMVSGETFIVKNSKNILHS